MKKSEFKEAIKEEIFEILAEADQEDIDAQADLNKELEATKGHRDDLGDSLSESLNPEVVKAVNRFIKAMAKRYDYSEQDAVFAIQAALKQRKFDKPTDIPGFEGTLDALNSLSIREEEDEPSAKDVKSSSKDSVSKIASKLQQTTKEMKSLVKKWKNSEGGEKDKLTSRLKDLTKIKKELEGLL